MTLVLMPDVEQLLVGFLLDQPEVTALVDDRVYTALPSSPEFPAVRVYQFNDLQATATVLWLVRYSLQIDVWGGSKKLTRTVADTVRAALSQRLTGSHDEGVVSGVDVGGLDTTPDASYTPAKPRCRFNCIVWAHPGVLVGS